MRAAEFNTKDSGSIPEVEEALNDLHSKFADFPEAQQKIYEVADWVNKQKDKTKESYKGETDKRFEEIGQVLKTTMNSIENFIKAKIL